MMGLEYPKTAEPVYSNHVPARKSKENQGDRRNLVTVKIL